MPTRLVNRERLKALSLQTDRDSDDSGMRHLAG
jgi:hypothetical protein